MCLNSEESSKAKSKISTLSTHLKEEGDHLETIPEETETAEEEEDSTTTASTDQGSPLNNLTQVEDDEGR